MRSIGKLFDLQQAQVFCDLLYLEGIDAQFEEDDGTLWIVDEDQLERAADHLVRFKANPEAVDSLDLHLRAEEKREAEYLDEERARGLQKSGRDLFPKAVGGLGGLLQNKPGPLTIGLIALSLLVSLLSGFGNAGWCLDYFYLSKLEKVADGYKYFLGLRELRDGQAWRLLTPIFIHMSFIHLLFNMWWLADLGAMLERRKGWLLMLLLVLLSGIGSNLLEVKMTSPVFGGMSGVVYGLLGYTWLMSQRAPGSGLFLHRTTAIFMLGWMVLGFVAPAMHMANYCHLGGLVIGLAFAGVELFVRDRVM